jgi:hypothetical protein
LHISRGRRAKIPFGQILFHFRRAVLNFALNKDIFRDILGKKYTAGSMLHIEPNVKRIQSVNDIKDTVPAVLAEKKVIP